MSATRSQKSVLIILLSNVFIAFLGIGLIIPIMPSFMNEMNLSGKTMGYLVSAFAFAQLIMSPIAGRWVDQLGRKKIIIIGLFIFSLSELIFGLGNHIFVFYLSRILGGISAAFIMPGVTAYVADITSMEDRPRALGYISAAISTGFIIGPGIGGFIAEYGIRVLLKFNLCLPVNSKTLYLNFNGLLLDTNQLQLHRPRREYLEKYQSILGIFYTLHSPYSKIELICLSNRHYENI